MLLQWLEYFLLHASTESELLYSIGNFLQYAKNMISRFTRRNLSFWRGEQSFVAALSRLKEPSTIPGTWTVWSTCAHPTMNMSCNNYYVQQIGCGCHYPLTSRSSHLCLRSKRLCKSKAMASQREQRGTSPQQPLRSKAS